MKILKSILVSIVVLSFAFCNNTNKVSVNGPAGMCTVTGWVYRYEKPGLWGELHLKGLGQAEVHVSRVKRTDVDGIWVYYGVLKLMKGDIAVGINRYAMTVTRVDELYAYSMAVKNNDGSVKYQIDFLDEEIISYTYSL